MINSKIAEAKNFLSSPPDFTEEKLKEILHYTNCEENPFFEAFKSNSFYKFFSGAKGVTKSFSRMIITIYRLVNEKNFCSVWCRNQINHIKNTLRPMLLKVLDFLKEVHNLDYFPYIYITAEAAYWNFDDGGEGRAIYFQNWEKIQAFQGFTLKKMNFRFGELVVDEPIEDTNDTTKLPHELEQIYKLQEGKLPLLIQNTVLREKTPKNFKIDVSFCYNIFTTDHFLIKKFHNKIIELKKPNGKLNEENLNKLIENKFLQVENNAFGGKEYGAIITMFSRYFPPAETISDAQKEYLENLKEEDFRMWIITVAGFAFEEPKNRTNYFLEPYLFDDEGNLREDLKETISNQQIEELFRKNEIMGVFDGFDPGIVDASCWVRILLTSSNKVIVYKFIQDIKSKIPQNINRININIFLAEQIKENNLLIENWLSSNNVIDVFFNQKTSILFTDNDVILEMLNQTFQENKIKTLCSKAIRRDTKIWKFGIINRQNWQKFIFEKKLIIFTDDTLSLLPFLAKQIILFGEEKRDEKLSAENRKIYDAVNAFEYSASHAHKIQFLSEARRSRLENWRRN